MGVSQSVFEAYRTRVAVAGVPRWKVRLAVAALTLVGMLVLLLLLPLILVAGLLAALWIGYVRFRLWAMSRRGPSDGEGRENVRVLVRDA
jgi:hypothetical protein